MEGLLKKLLSLLLNSSQSKYPPPESVAVITGMRLKELLKPYGINLKCPLDYEYKLPSKADYERFLRWYRDSRPYDEFYNCDAFAWVMVAEALKWMHGECPFGYLEASSTDADYQFPMHAFCFAVDWNEAVWFCDELEVAARKDKLDPAYEVNCQDAKV